MCIGDHIIAHLLWADDLILFSDSIKGIQKQLNGLFKFCSNNMMIVNEVKTKMMLFGTGIKGEVLFNGKKLDWVDDYKYLGNLISGIKGKAGDVFKNNYNFLSEKARRAIFLLFKKTKSFGKLSPEIMIHFYNALIKPILLYGSDVWGFNKKSWDISDKVSKWFIRCILNIKPTTSNLITFGEVGIIPPSIYSKINAMLFYLRVKSMSEDSMPRIVFNELMKLDSMGFITWITSIKSLARDYCVDLCNTEYNDVCIQDLKRSVVSKYQSQWIRSINNIDQNPLLRTYKLFKKSYRMDPYLKIIKNDCHRTAMCKFRCSSHMLEIERGRHTNPVTPVDQRICKICNELDNEIHFLLFCKNNDDLRQKFFSEIVRLYPAFTLLLPPNMFVFLLTTEDENILCKLSKFIFESFKLREMT